MRISKGLNQSEMEDGSGVSGSTWSNYERGISSPEISTILRIADFFTVSVDELLRVNLSDKSKNVHLFIFPDQKNKSKNVHPNVHPNVHLNREYQDNEPIQNYIKERQFSQLGSSNIRIPITDIKVAAGAGLYAPSFIENCDVITLPNSFLKPDRTYLTVAIKGESMAPTLMDGGKMVIRHLDRTEWAKMPDERIYAVVDSENKVYLKRVKNRFKQGFIVLKSDSPDKATHPNFNLGLDEISSIWYAEWYLTAKMPNIHDQYYTRLQALEDRFEAFLSVNRKLK